MRGAANELFLAMSQIYRLFHNDSGEESRHFNGRPLQRATLSLVSIGERRRKMKQLRNFRSFNHSGWLNYITQSEKVHYPSTV